MPELAQLAAIRRSVAWVGRMSDGLVRIGPWSIGLDGVLGWIPGLGEAYSAGAAAFLLTQGVRAGVPAPTLLLTAALMGGRTLVEILPVAGPLIADIFTLHKLSANLIIAAIDKKIAEAGGAAPSDASTRAKPPVRQPLWRTRRARDPSSGVAA